MASSVHFKETAKLARLRELQGKMIELGKAPVSLAKSHQAALDALAARWDLNGETRRAGADVAWDAFDREARGTLEAFNAVKAERDQIVRELTASHRQPAGTEAELLRQAAWSRLEATLNTLGPGVVRFGVADKLLRQAAEVGDEATLQAARRELPAHLARHNEMLPAEMATWLDIVAGPEDAAEARLIEQDKATDLQVSELAVNTLARAVQQREVPGTLPYPSGVDGQRVRGVTEEGEKTVAQLPPQVGAA